MQPSRNTPGKLMRWRWLGRLGDFFLEDAENRRGDCGFGLNPNQQVRAGCECQGGEKGLELLTFGVSRRKSSKTETMDRQKARFRCVGGWLAEVSQEANLEENHWGELAAACRNSMKSTAANHPCARKVRKGSKRPTGWITTYLLTQEQEEFVQKLDVRPTYWGWV